jgi:transposase, IS5 family
MEVFLDEINQVVPWAALVAPIHPHVRGAHQALGGRSPVNAKDWLIFDSP